MSAKKKSHVKGFYRKRPGGGRTWVRPHTRSTRQKLLAGGAIGVAVLVGLAMYAKNENQEVNNPQPPPQSASPTPPR